MKIVVKFEPKDEPLGKLADAELHFLDIPIIGNCKLVGFGIWERRGGTGRNLTLPARQYRINGESRAFAQLRPIDGDHDGTRALRDAILEAFAHVEANAALQDGDGSGDVSEVILWEWTGPTRDDIKDIYAEGLTVGMDIGKKLEQ